MRTDDTGQTEDAQALSRDEMVQRVRQGQQAAKAFKRRTAPPPLITHRTRMRLLVVAVITAAVLLTANLAGTVRDLTGHDPAKPSVTSQHISTPGRGGDGQGP
jgi:hypothetical protein